MRRMGIAVVLGLGLLCAGCLMPIAIPQGTSNAARSSNGQVTICHKGKTLRVAQSAVQAHLKHGDHRGPCH